MKRQLAWVLRIVTILLVGVSIWTAYANVFSDDLDVRARAGQLALTTAGCDDRCKFMSMHGSRGMIDEEIEYDIGGPNAKGGHFVVVCRRAYIFAGDYACTATKK